MSRDEQRFEEFFQASWDPCLRAVAVTTGDMRRAENQVAEAFARAWASWRPSDRKLRGWASCTAAPGRAVNAPLAAVERPL